LTLLLIDCIILVLNLGLSINLEALKEEVMETGSWYWNYQLNGSHIHLQQVEVSQS